RHQALTKARRECSWSKLGRQLEDQTDRACACSCSAASCSSSPGCRSRRMNANPLSRITTTCVSSQPSRASSLMLDSSALAEAADRTLYDHIGMGIVVAPTFGTSRISLRLSPRDYLSIHRTVTPT